MPTQGQTSRGYEVEEREQGRVAVLRFLDEDLSYYHADSLRRDLRSAVEYRIRRGSRTILLDLYRVRVIDSGGIGLILSVNNHCAGLDAKFGIARTSSFVRHVLGIVGAHRHVKLFETLEEAIATLHAPPETEESAGDPPGANPDGSDLTAS